MKLLAKAIYDNEAESDEELDFKKNDILEVINKNQDGLEGWWLCKLNDKTGLAPGNRLKIIDDRSEKTISLNSRTILPIKRIESIQSQSNSAKNSQFITNSVENILNNYQTSSTNTTKKSLSVDISSSHDDDDNEDADNNDEDDYDYEYDIPLNNNELSQTQKRAQIQQLITNKQLTKITQNSNESTILKTRKSNSPTIDSGISSSLISLNESTLSTHEQQQHTHENIPNEIYLRNNLKNIRDTLSTLLNIQKIHAKDSRKRSNLENSIQIIKCNCNELNKHLHDLFEYLKINNSKIKLNNNNNKLKDYQLQLHKFINFYDSNLLILNSINWNIELLDNFNNNKCLNINNELSEILSRLNYLNDLIRLIYDCLIQQSNTKSQIIQVKNDNNDNDVYENDDYEWLSNNNNNNSNKKEIENLIINTNDKLLIKFYFKIIENNLNEMLETYKKLKANNQNKNNDDFDIDNESHKLALNGHKLVFICDTLNRNIKNKTLKYELEETSNNLCDNLKLYVIRMKQQQQQQQKQQQLINESLMQICNNASKLKQLLVKVL